MMLLSTSDSAAQSKGNAYGKGSGNDRPGKSSFVSGRNKATGVPIDGGAGLLLAAGAAYGLKKLRDYNKGKKIT